MNKQQHAKINCIELSVCFTQLRGCIGLYTPLNKNAAAKIQVFEKLSPAERIEILYHEFTHFVCDLLGRKNYKRFMMRSARRVSKSKKNQKLVGIKKTLSQEERLAYAVAEQCARMFHKYMRPPRKR